MPIQFIDGEEVVQCPACKGRGYLVVWDDSCEKRDENDERVTALGIGELCTHCMGDGFIPAKR